MLIDQHASRKISMNSPTPSHVKYRDRQAAEKRRRSACKATGIFMGILVIAAALGKGIDALNNRKVCRDWGKELERLDREEYGTFTDAAWRKWEYKWAAEVNCQSSLEEDFCKGWNWEDQSSWENYPPKDNLPAAWRIMDPEWCDTDEGILSLLERNQHPGMPLTCFARITNRTRDLFAAAKRNLTAAIEMQPFGCLRNRLRRDTLDYSTLDRNY